MVGKGAWKGEGKCLSGFVGSLRAAAVNSRCSATDFKWAII
jgi:hypothetical protein